MIELEGVPDFGRVGHYERKGLYTIEEVIPFIQKKDQTMVTFDDDEINMGSIRYKVFAEKLACVNCGIAATFFAKERAVYWHKPSDRYWPTSHRYHFNLYAVTDRGHVVMLTKDHIYPRSQGGSDELDNLQTMCAPCNSRKRDRMPHETDEQYAARRRAERDSQK